ncbi:hypothetical protein C8R43DRAFT_942474 [Mycena crocata]|nr:hypothetical protein C8R43DRAFT_960601 [Mycena crocata]KAJ7178874.1 hypothetical protein C8R43DRAFT_942474 [Mycena crocata]
MSQMSSYKSRYKSFAVVGGGPLGLPIVGALAAQNVSVGVELASFRAPTPHHDQKLSPQASRSPIARLTSPIQKQYKVDVMQRCRPPRQRLPAPGAQKPVDAAKLLH